MTAFFQLQSRAENLPITFFFPLLLMKLGNRFPFICVWTQTGTQLFVWLYVFNFGDNSSEICVRISKDLVLWAKCWCHSLGFPLFQLSQYSGDNNVAYWRVTTLKLHWCCSAGFD